MTCWIFTCTQAFTYSLILPHTNVQTGQFVAVLFVLCVLQSAGLRRTRLTLRLVRFCESHVFMWHRFFQPLLPVSSSASSKPNSTANYTFNSLSVVGLVFLSFSSIRQGLGIQDLAETLSIGHSAVMPSNSVWHS